MENLLFEIVDGIATVTVNRPAAMNALTMATLEELAGLVDGIVRNPEIRVAVLTGAGKKAFVAGADIAEMQHMVPAEARNLALLAHQIYAPSNSRQNRS